MIEALLIFLRTSSPMKVSVPLGHARWLVVVVSEKKAKPDVSSREI